jgi:hypothetical protein
VKRFLSYASSSCLVVASGIAAAACGSDFDPGSRVSDYRLVAVAVDKPYAAPGEEVTATVLAVEPFGRPITYAWTTCENPSDTTANACLAKIAEDARAGRAPVIQQGRDASFRWRVPETALSSLVPEARAGATAGIVTVGCPGTLELQDLAGGGAGLPFRCLEAGSGQVLPYERWVVSVKRVFLRAKDRNANPTLGGVTWNGAPWPEAEVKEIRACDNDSNMLADCAGGEEAKLGASPAPGAVESGVDEYGTAFTELAVVQYYATEGTFEFEARTAETAPLGTKWVARASARGKEVTMWFVIRDNRGGVSWTTRRVRVRG